MTTERTNALRALEASVLGAILCRPETLAEMPAVEVADFVDVRHRCVFTAMRNLEAASRPIDVVTVQAELARQGDVVASDFAFLGGLAMSFPTPDNVADYVRQIRSASIARKVRAAMADVVTRGDDLELEGEELLSMALASLSRIDDVTADDTVGIDVLVRKRFKQLEAIAEERANGSRTMTGYPTGVASLDDRIGGWQAGIASIVAARPGMGKSSLGLATADACSAADFGVHLFSLEDTEEAYADRTMSRGSSVPAEAMRNAQLNRGQCDSILRAHAKLRGRKWLVDGRSGLRADEIVRSVRRHRKANDTRVVIVDYVQLVKKSNPRQSPHEALTEIVTTLADAAKADKMAYVIMSQLNRDIEKRQDKRPQMSDLRESGSLEERAKCVVGLYRGSYYGDPIKGIDWDPSWKGHACEPDQAEFDATAQVIVLKNNNGPTGTTWAHWVGETTTLS